MKRKILAAALLVLVLAGCSSAPAQPQATPSAKGVTLTSTLNGEARTITYPKAPERVVSLAGFATELLLALGLEEKIVGYAWQDNPVLPQYQSAFDTLHSLSDAGTDPGAEVVLAAQPDMVLSWASGSDEDYFSYNNLSAKGILSYGFASEQQGATLESVYTDIANLGKIFGVEAKAQALVEEMQSNIQQVVDRVKDNPPVSVFVCDVGSSPEQAFTAGGGLVADLLHKAGARNIITDTNKNWTRVSWEAIAAAQPDYIVIDYYTNAADIQGTKAFLKNHPALGQLEAVQQERFVVVSLTDISAGERNDDTVALLADAFHKEQ